jgi:hypothetical protein
MRKFSWIDFPMEVDPEELFGFDRTRDISEHSAQQIADAAARFGQEDDITVLTVRLSAIAATV